MSSFFGFVVGLLQAALSLVGFVQQHPELPQTQKDHAQVVAQQAITQATQALANQNANTPSSGTGARSPALQFQIAQSENGSLIATPIGNNSWDFVIAGHFAIMSDAYHIDFGDGSTVDLTCQSSSQNDNYDCVQFVKVTHSFASGQSYKVQLYTIARAGVNSNRYDLIQMQLLTTSKHSNTSASSHNAFTALPKSGAAPLTVTFSYPFSQDREAPVVVFGDTTPQEHMACSRGGCTLSHTYTNTGTYTVMLEAYPASCKLEPWTLCGDSPAVHVVDTATITVSGGTQSSISVPGMSKYTDTDFGFSFWYPSEWKVQEHTPSKAPDTYFPGGIVRKSYNIMGSDGSLTLSISPVASDAGSITLQDDNGNTYTLYFDKSSHTWMRCLSKSGVAVGDCAHATSIAPADASTNSMGGLHIINTVGSNSSGLLPDVVPLSAHNFVIVYHYAEKIDALAKTIVALDPVVATPVSTAEQIATIKAELAAYAGQ